MVMNCVNLHSMKPVKWLSSPRWMGHRSSKVRTQELERGGGAKGWREGESMRRKGVEDCLNREAKKLTLFLKELSHLGGPINRGR